VNLLSNAVKFTPRGGTVTVTVTESAEGLSVDIADTGIGIPQEDIPKVLEPFSRGAPQPRSCHQGTGLGLPLAKALMELHGGRLEIESEVGAGTTVTVTIPRQRILRRDCAPA